MKIVFETEPRSLFIRKHSLNEVYVTEIINPSCFQHNYKKSSKKTTYYQRRQ